MDDFGQMMPGLDLSKSSQENNDNTVQENTDSSTAGNEQATAPVSGEMPSFEAAVSAADSGAPKFEIPSGQPIAPPPIPPRQDFSDFGYANMQPPVAVKNKKKVLIPIIAVLCAIALIFGGFASCYAFLPGFANKVNLTVMKPDSYYRWAESNTYKTAFGAISAGEKAKTDGAVKGSLSCDISGEKSDIDFALEKLGSAYLVNLSAKGDSPREIFAYVDKSLDEYYYKDSECADEYLKISKIVAEKIFGKSSADSKTATKPEDSLGKKYLDIYTNSIKNTERTTGPVSVGENTYDMTVVSYELDKDKLVDVLTALLEEAKDDKELAAILERNGITNEQVLSLYNSVNMINKGIYGELNMSLKMKNYINSLGVITGREVTIQLATGVSIRAGYKFGISPSDANFEIFFGGAGNTVSVQSTAKRNGKAWDGYVSVGGEKLFEYTGITPAADGDKLLLDGEASYSLDGDKGEIKLYSENGAQAADISGTLGGEQFSAKLSFTYDKITSLDKPDLSGAREISTTQDLEEAIPYLTFEDGKLNIDLE